MQNSHYQRIGGEATVLKLVNRFYDLMDELQETKEIRLLHAPDLSDAREKLFLFLSSWLGGPPLYINKYGHPRLRQRHMPFPIGIKERDQWMLCMTRAMQDVKIDEAIQQELTAAFFKTADFMRNKDE